MRYKYNSNYAAREAIAALSEFEGNSMRGQSRPPLYRGWLNDREAEAYDAAREDIDYVVISYQTPIAWHTREGWFICDRTFSAMTSKHQSHIRAAVGYHYATITFNANVTPRQGQALYAAQHGLPVVGIFAPVTLRTLANRGYLTADRYELTRLGRKAVA